VTPDDVRNRVTEIEGLAYDDEAAHAREDDLYRDLLTAIGNGVCQEPGLCAAIALRTQSLRFRRWCA
jgi:hypothetical protein